MEGFSGFICSIICIRNFLVFGAILVFVRVYNTLTVGMCKSRRRMDGKTVVITGANAGIGKETALQLARRGARIVMGCRDLTRATKARDEIVAASGNSDVVVRHLDLSSLASVRRFAEEVLASEQRIDVLVNNAGIAGRPSTLTNDGLNITMQSNYFGHFLLTNLLLGLLKKSAPSRIVVVSSGLHLFSWMRPGKINKDRFANSRFPYSDSKLAGILMSRELSKKLRGTGVTSNSLHPGVIVTNILNNVVSDIYLRISNLFVKSMEEGAQTTIMLAVDEELENVSGKYFSDCAEGWASPLVSNDALAEELWKFSEELVGLKPEERLY